MRFTILANGPSDVITAAALAALAALPLVAVQVLGDPYQAPRAFVAAIAVTALLATARRVPKLARREAIALSLLGGLVAWSLVSGFLSHPASSLWGVQGRFQGFASLVLLALAALAGTRLRRRDLLFLAGAVGSVSVLLAATTLAQAVAGKVPQAFFGNPTIAGAWFAVVAGTSLAAALAVPAPRWRLTFAGVAATSVLACGVTGSRSAVIAAVVAGAAVSLASRRLSARTAMVGVIALAALLIVGVTIGGFGASKFTPGALLEGSARSRLEIWRGTGGMIADHPAFGVGPGRFLYEFPAYQPIEHAIAEGPNVRPDQAHGLPVQLAAEAGLPAALVWLALAGISLSVGWRASRSGNGAALIAVGGLAAYLAQGVFGVSAVETDVLGWMLGGVALTSLSAATQGESRVLRYALTLLGCVLALAVGWYATANASYGRGLDRYAMGDLTISASELKQAVSIDPFTDVYRVALADTASYSSDVARVSALAVLERGLAYEPRSFDLALAKARLMRAMGSAPEEVARAYETALALYPYGVAVREETVVALRSAGRTEDANSTAALLEQLDRSATPTESP